MLFGGAKGLAVVPSVNDFIDRSLAFLKLKLDRQGRGRAVLFWRGAFALIVLGTLCAAAGLVVNAFAFTHPAFVAVSVFFVAKSLALKQWWQAHFDPDAMRDAAACRGVVRQAASHLAWFFLPAVFLFLLTGFAGLFPYLLLAAMQKNTDGVLAPQGFAKPFALVKKVPDFLGSVLAAVLLAFATLLWPPASWQKSWAALFQPRGHWLSLPLETVGHAFAWSIERHSSASKTDWAGPESGTARLDQQDARNGLILVLIAFGLSQGLLLLLLLAAWIG